MASKELHALSSVSKNVLLPVVLSDGRCSDSTALLALPSWHLRLSPLGLYLCYSEYVPGFGWLQHSPVMESFRRQSFSASLGHTA